jgi:CRISPR/Cas system-associated exonuclease Cas4 (RecB family)
MSEHNVKSYSDLGAINQSRIKCFTNCHRQHHYKYILQVPMDSPIKSRALTFGSSFHWLVEQQEDFPDMKPEDLPRITEEVIDEETYQEAIVTFKEYQWHYRNDPLRYHAVDGHRTEIPLEVHTKTGLTLKGTADGIVEYQGGLWLVDHKTFGRAIPSMHELTFSRQSTYYTYLFERAYGIKLQGMLWDYVKSKPIKDPRFDGLTFRKPSKQVLPFHAASYMFENKRALAQYSWYLQLTVKNTKDYFVRIAIPRDEDIYEQMLRKIQKAITEIKTIGKTARDPSIGPLCTFCQYRARCIEDNRKEKIQTKKITEV